VERLLAASARRTIDEIDPSIAKGVYSQIGGTLLQFGPGPKPLSGGGGNHIVAAQVSLVSSDLRDISGQAFARLWRAQFGSVVGLESLIFKYDTGASEGAAIELSLSHRSREVTERVASELAAALETYAGVTDIDDGVANGKVQLSFTVTEAGRSLGLTAYDIGRQVRSAFYGNEAIRQQRGRDELKVMVRLPLDERQRISTLENLVLRSPDGSEIPLVDAAKIHTGRSYTSINRKNGRRVVTVTAEVDNAITSAGQVIESVLTTTMADLQNRYSGLTYSFGGEREAQRETLQALGVGFMIAMLVIYALLAIPFQSYVQPLIVMLSIPFGIIGAIGGHYLLGYGLSIVSMFGVIALSGVVVNDSLVLVVTANRLRQQGIDAMTAIRRAGERRFRPILLTSLTTFFGLAPMIFESSMQARFLIPMAISLGFGILFATVIILLIVPSVYMILDDVQTKIHPLGIEMVRRARKVFRSKPALESKSLGR
jgi:multidrug efflux pump subunit AcrB